MLIPLMPSSGNLSRSVYILADLVLFVAVSVQAMRGVLTTIMKALLVAGAINLCFGLADLLTYLTGTAELMSVIRNANYAMQVGVAIGGVKRLAGSFTEASAFGAITLFFFALSLELWLSNRFRKVAGAIALSSFVAILFATSSSTYVGLGVYGLLLWLRCGLAVLGARSDVRKMGIAVLGPFIIFIVIASLMLMPLAWETVLHIADATLVNKLNTQSGIERWYWNENGLRVFSETDMLGAGLGSVRTSSLMVALLANVGIGGVVLFLAFLGSLAFTAARSAGNSEAG